MRLLPHTLQGRFLAGLLAAMLLMCVFFAVVLRLHTRELLASEAREKANLMVAHTEAIQGYVRSTLRPALAGHIASDDFIIEAMSTSYVTRHILSALSIDSRSFVYRRVSASPRNPEYAFNDEERELAAVFENAPALPRLDRSVIRNGVEFLVMARPVYFTRDCMRCHGDPADAPEVLIAMYGPERGFGKAPGEMAGLDIVSVSMENSGSAVSGAVGMFTALFAVGMLLLFIVVHGFFNRLVVHNLRRVGDILQRVFFQQDGETMLAPLRSQVEIEDMVRSIEAVATHLGEARRQLSDYAVNLESKVRERTVDLERAAGERKADVQVFVSLLRGLNETQGKGELLRRSLRLIATRFGADRAFYACGLSGADFTVWPDTGGTADPLPAWLEDQLSRPQEFLTLEEPRFYQDMGQDMGQNMEQNIGQDKRHDKGHDSGRGCWLIPAQSTGNTRGVVGLLWEKSKAPSGKPGGMPADMPGGGQNTGQDDARAGLAMALGRQLAIALDNLEAMDTLLRQNSLLDSIVEGVPDPIILVEDGGSPVIANNSALSLAGELCPPADGGLSRAAGLLGRLGLRRELDDTRQGDAPRELEIAPPGERSFAVGLYPLMTRGAPARRTIVHIRETTAEKRLLVQVRRSEKLAVVGQLAAGIAHEINNPLGVIRCYAELLAAGCPDGRQQEDIAVILHHVDQARAVLRDLLDFSRPRTNEVADCELPVFLRSLRDLFKAKASGAGAALRLDLPEFLPVIKVDKAMLEQVLVNLLLNAIAAANKDRGEIVLSAAVLDGGGRVGISVEDNGPGIDESALAKIFDPFFTTKPAGSGTGLGLTVAYGMMREMRGSLEARNIYRGPDRAGVRFTATVPVDCTEIFYAAEAI